jgi:hypothetical protein
MLPPPTAQARGGYGGANSGAGLALAKVTRPDNGSPDHRPFPALGKRDDCVYAILIASRVMIWIEGNTPLGRLLLIDSSLVLFLPRMAAKRKRQRRGSTSTGVMLVVHVNCLLVVH